MALRSRDRLSQELAALKDQMTDVTYLIRKEIPAAAGPIHSLKAGVEKLCALRREDRRDTEKAQATAKQGEEDRLLLASIKNSLSAWLPLPGVSPQQQVFLLGSERQQALESLEAVAQELAKHLEATCVLSPVENIRRLARDRGETNKLHVEKAKKADELRAELAEVKAQARELQRQLKLFQEDTENLNKELGTVIYEGETVFGAIRRLKNDVEYHRERANAQEKFRSAAERDTLSVKKERYKLRGELADVYRTLTAFKDHMLQDIKRRYPSLQYMKDVTLEDDTGVVVAEFTGDGGRARYPLFSGGAESANVAKLKEIDAMLTEAGIGYSLGSVAKVARALEMLKALEVEVESWRKALSTAAGLTYTESWVNLATYLRDVRTELARLADANFAMGSLREERDRLRKLFTSIGMTEETPLEDCLSALIRRRDALYYDLQGHKREERSGPSRLEIAAMLLVGAVPAGSPARAVAMADQLIKAEQEFDKDKG
jgi:chromosome segregation ATPase